MSDVREAITEAFISQGYALPNVADALVPVVARLIAEAEERGAAKVRERVEAVRIAHADDCMVILSRHGTQCDCWLRDLRAALTDEPQP